MADERPQLLPKGIVVNAPDVEHSIEGAAGAPVDTADIERMWKVYTTTGRRLLDPTAIRLEHFWWRIWGSRRRELSATIIAAHFHHISHGDTFVPLRGLANRDESGTPDPTSASSDSKSRLTMPHGESRPSTTSSVSAAKLPAISPLPPILKKSDAPPQSGPRPSVGFASIVSSDDETENSSSVSAISHQVFDSPIPDSQVTKLDKKGKKKSQPFVASKGGKKRPVMVRRTSSKSSTDTKAALAAAAASEAAHADPTSKSKGKEKAVASKFQENFSLSPDTTPNTSKPKSSANGSRLKSGESSSKSAEASESSFVIPAVLRNVTNTSANGDPGPSTLRNMHSADTSVAEGNLTLEDLEELEVQRALMKDFEKQKKVRGKAAQRDQATAATRPPGHDDTLEISPTSRLQTKPSEKTVAGTAGKFQQPSLSHGTLPELNAPASSHDKKGGTKSKAGEKAKVSHVKKEASRRVSDQDRSPTSSQQVAFKSSASTGENLQPARGELDLGDNEAGFTTKNQQIVKGTKENGSVEPMFAKRAVPVAQTTSTLSASMPANNMARSKSHLSLLLDKDRSRGGGDSHKDKDKDSKRRGKKE